MDTTIMNKLRVKLTPAEKDAKGELLAKLCFDLGELEEQKKASSAEFSAKIKTLKAENQGIVYDVRSGTEERSVECREVPIWRDGVAETRRLDTGEVVYKRPLTAEEKQQRFDHYIADDDAADDEPTPGSH
jgi:hypothetical protein